MRGNEPRILSPFMLAELDYLLDTHIGRAAEPDFLNEVPSGAYRLESFSAQDVHAARQIIERFAALDFLRVDPSIVVLAKRYGCNDVLTLDHRYFRTVLGPSQHPFCLLPSDSLPAEK